jgi:hypothetical protein
MRKYVLAPVWNHEYSWPFRQPVDVIGLQLTDYYSVIEHPMDLGTITTRFQKNHHQSAEDVIKDFDQMFYNCYLYNGSSSDVGQMGNVLEAVYKHQLALMPGTQFTDTAQLQMEPVQAAVTTTMVRNSKAVANNRHTLTKILSEI